MPDIPTASPVGRRVIPAETSELLKQLQVRVRDATRARPGVLIPHAYRALTYAEILPFGMRQG